MIPNENTKRLTASRLAIGGAMGEVGRVHDDLAEVELRYIMALGPFGPVAEGDREGMDLKDIYAALDLRKETVSGAGKRLVGKGYIMQRRFEDDMLDQRSMESRLTEKGYGVYREVRLTHGRLMDSMGF